MAGLATTLAELAYQLDALMADVEKSEKADVKKLKPSLERIQRATSDALERLATVKRKPVALDPIEDWSHIVVGGPKPKT